MDVPLLGWIGVVAAIAALLLADLFVLHRDAHEVLLREAVWRSALWISLGLAFGAGVWAIGGADAGSAYFGGYLLEKALSVENVFVLAVLLGAFAVPAMARHRLLFWGVFGALVLRGAFIALGAAALDRFHWAMYGFGVLLVISAWRLLVHDDAVADPTRNPVLRLLRRVTPMTQRYEGQRFWVRAPHPTKANAKRWVATPMLAALVAVETSDVVFAIDSIPAVFAVTEEPFLVFTSNAFAVLGLRALFFLLAGALHRLRHLKPALAIVLALIGMKMLLAEVVHLPVWAPLVAIAAVLTVAIGTSLGAPTRAHDTRSADPIRRT